MIKNLLLKLSREYPHYGFQTLFGLLRSMGNLWNHKRVRRIYCELKLNLKRKPKKRLAPRTAQRLVVPEKVNDTQSIDFMHDSLSCGRRFRTMNVIDNHRRQCLGIKVAFSISSRLATQHLDEIAFMQGYPKKIICDDGRSTLHPILKIGRIHIILYCNSFSQENPRKMVLLSDSTEPTARLSWICIPLIA